MTAPSDNQISELLRAWSDGDQAALEQLTPIVYAELHRLAKHYLGREGGRQSIQATELVNEAYLRLVNAKDVPWRDRAHFLAVAARVMRRILVDHARSRHYQKRGGDAVRVTLDDALVVTREPDADFVALDDALTALEAIDARKSQVVEMRFFGGLTIDETAEALQISRDTVKRDWSIAKLWLLRELRAGSNDVI